MYFTCRGDRISHKFLNGNIWPKFFEAPEPTLIMWENFGATLTNRILRTICVNMLFIFIILGGLYTLNLADQYTDQFRLSRQTYADFNYDDCVNYGNITQEQAFNDLELEDSQKVILGCYCYTRIDVMPLSTTIDEIETKL
jgi:hypothetical protein